MVVYNHLKVKDSVELAELASRIISDNIEATLNSKQRCQIALSGGSTPQRAYNLLKDKPLEWNKVDVFLGDERWVDPSDEASNDLMIRNTLLSGSEASKASFYPVPIKNSSSPKESASLFSDLVDQVCVGNPPKFDFVLLGLGDDGHTASLFPNSPSLEVGNVTATTCSGKGHERITLTAAVLSSAENVLFLVSGKSKQTALKRLLDPSEPYTRTPAKLIKTSSEIIILSDQEANENA